jgi:hypothetical protein
MAIQRLPSAMRSGRLSPYFYSHHLRTARLLTNNRPRTTWGRSTASGACLATRRCERYSIRCRRSHYAHCSKASFGSSSEARTKMIVNVMPLTRIIHKKAVSFYNVLFQIIVCEHSFPQHAGGNAVRVAHAGVIGICGACWCSVPGRHGRRQGFSGGRCGA